MTDREEDAGDKTDRRGSVLPSRRALLSSVAAIGTATGLAGCSNPFGGVRSVAATPVVLSPRGQGLLGLSAFEFEATTRTVTPEDAPAEVEVTSYLAVHGGPEEPDRLPVRFDVSESAAHALGTLAVPAPDLLGQSLNPVAEQPFPELLTGERGRRLVSRAGVLDSPEFDWVRGPTRVGTDDGELLGTGTTAESYLGVVSDGDATRTLLSQLTRVDNEGDVVLVGEFVWRATPAGAIETDEDCADDDCQLPIEQLGAFLDRLTTGWGHVDICGPLSDDPTGGVGACEFDTPTAVPQLSVTNVRVVQQVESTRVEETGSNPTIRHQEPDPDLVRGENSAVVFEFDTLDNLDAMGSGTEFHIDVFSGDSGGNARYQRAGTISLSKNDLEDIAGGEHTISVLHDLSKFGSDGNPVFELETGEVKFSPRSSGYVLDSGVKTTHVVLPKNIRDVAPLRVGFIPLVDAPRSLFKSPGDRYGDASGLPRVPLDTYKTMTEYLQRVYPGDVVTYLHQNQPFPGDATKALGGMNKEMAEVDNALHNIATGGWLTNGNFPNGGTLRTDGRNRSAVVSDIRQNGFDVTVAIVPGVAVNNSGASDYYGYHGNPDWAGVAFGANAAVSSVGVLPSGDGQAVSHTVAQEIGHFFQDDYLGPSPDHPMAQRRDSDTNAAANGDPLDASHARHKGSSNDGISGKDDPGVESVGYDLEDGFRNVQLFTNYDGSFESRGRTPYNSMDTVPSYMSYTGVDSEVWADARIHQQLIDTGTGEQWNAGLFGNSNANTMLTATGRVAEDGTVRYEDVWTMEGYERYVDDEANPVEVALLGPDREELVSARVPVAVGATHDHSHAETPHQPMFTLPFESGGVHVRTTYDDRTTTMNPVVRSVRDAVRRVPDRGFAGEHDAARKRIGAALEEVAGAMARGDYDEAAAVMDGEVRERIGESLVEYEAALDQRTPAAMADLLDKMVERLVAAR
ncbi:DUF6517 family protein [Haloplanus salilacus]|uniref:DUF6517 family protein n=1 Tax=Haloplanus salilacus TaxID=2949994 RepID=UPI0030D41F89